ncbi:hypothetical protein [uncultured Pseudoflavonifractor sp.]|uniref:hypothetical protein n=1 Tax=uncultured Pseudoflavonifractor sp. TaxID=1221379 RepID=UPI00260048B7|nr:hypothetical protein [uncultured Pseudoflavonifractor sp.]
MNLVFLQYPLIPILLALSLVLTALAGLLRRGGGAAAALAAVSVGAMAVAALACSVPYEEILLLLLLPALTCFLTVARGEKK